MARNGSGTYNLPNNTWFPGVNGVTATTADWNTTATDIQAALTQSVSSDGQTALTGNLQAGNNKITGLAVGTANTDSATVAQTVGRLLNVQRLTASGTYTRTTGAINGLIIMCGGGGGGGGSAANGASQVSGGTGGAAGSSVEAYFALPASQAYTIGGGGNGGGIGGSGTAGGTTTFGSYSAPGGNGGVGGASGVPPWAFQGGLNGAAGSGGNIQNNTGQPGDYSFSLNTSTFITGRGAPSIFGGGGAAIATGTSNGANAGSPGGGGGGAGTGATGGGNSGGSGGAGVIVIYEYA